jgi:hypothetical protein
MEAVPTGIALSRHDLFVTLFRGFPFAPGTSHVVEVDRETGAIIPRITNLKTAIDVLPLGRWPGASSLVMQHASNNGPGLGGPGLLLFVPGDGSAPVVLADCLNRPVSMTVDWWRGKVYVTELTGGRVVSLSDLDDAISTKR